MHNRHAGTTVTVTGMHGVPESHAALTELLFETLSVGDTELLCKIKHDQGWFASGVDGCMLYPL